VNNIRSDKGTELSKIITALKRIVFSSNSDNVAETYEEELGRQAYFLSLIAGIILLFVWLTYIPIDQALFPDEHAMLYFRVGLTVVAAIVLGLRFVPFFRRNGIYLALIIESYLLIATGVLTGLTKADPAYMGGYLFIIMVTLIAPIRLYQNYILLLLSVTGFFMTAVSRGTDFTGLHAQYSIRDLSSTLLIAGVFYLLIDRYRYRAYLRAKELEKERNNLAVRNRIIEKELIMARTIQQRLIPSQNPQEWISAIYKPMDLVGGDFYDFIFFRDTSKIGVFLSDVSGHGIPAAFITSMLKSFILQAGNLREDPAMLLHYLNGLLTNQTNNNFITALYGIVDMKKLTFNFSNAGHYAPYVIHDSSVCQLLPEKGGTPLAIFSNDELVTMNRGYKNRMISIEPSSKLIFVTDGLLEAESIEGEAADFENERLMEQFFKNEDLNSHDFVLNVYESLIKHRGSERFEDDVCLICVDIEPPKL